MSGSGLPSSQTLTSFDKCLHEEIYIPCPPTYKLLTMLDKLLYGWIVLDYNWRWSNSAECIQRSIKLCQRGCLMQAELVIVPLTGTPSVSTLVMWLRSLLELRQMYAKIVPRCMFPILSFNFAILQGQTFLDGDWFYFHGAEAWQRGAIRRIAAELWSSYAMISRLSFLCKHTLKGISR